MGYQISPPCEGQNDYFVKTGGYFDFFVGLLVAAFFSTAVACML